MSNEKNAGTEPEITEYSTPIAEYSYESTYPDDARFEKPWDVCIQVGQGGGKSSKEGASLQSEDFSKCSALILQNAVTYESIVFHIADVDLNHEQIKLLHNLSEGHYIAQFVRGDLSRDIRSRMLKSNYFTSVFVGTRTIRFNDDVLVNTGNMVWALVYDPKEHVALVQSKKLKKVLSYKV